MRLETLQRSMLEAIDNGPDFIVETGFACGRIAALRGLAVHANTISHARLVALEETFPCTRTLMGADEFNALSRRFIMLAEAVAEPLNSIGLHFSAFLARSAKANVADLAAFEWAWLESYHAAEAEALPISHFADADERALVETRIGLHPAARLAPHGAGQALEMEAPGMDQASAILITRPNAEVLIAPASAKIVHLFEMLASPQPVCNLLQPGGEYTDEDGLHALLAMLHAGSLVLAG